MAHLAAVRISPVIRRNFLPAIAAALFFVACIVWRVDQFLDRSTPLEFYSGDVIPPSPHLNEPFDIAWDMVPRRQCPGTTYRRIIDAAGHAYTWAEQESLSGYIAPLNERVPRWIGRPLKLPARMSLVGADGQPHPSRFQATIKFVCHPWQKYWPIEVRLPEVRFIVQP